MMKKEINNFKERKKSSTQSMQKKAMLWYHPTVTMMNKL